MTRQPPKSAEPEWVETLMPMIVVGLIGLAIYSKRITILWWLAKQHILIDPPHHPPLTIYSGYGIDAQRILFLLVPAAAAVICAVNIAASIWRNYTAPRRPR
jgi:hypothetical protein